MKKKKKVLQQVLAFCGIRCSSTVYGGFFSGDTLFTSKPAQDLGCLDRRVVTVLYLAIETILGDAWVE